MELIASSRPTELRLRVLGCVTWALQAWRASTPAPAALSLLAFCASASSFVVAWQRPGLPFGWVARLCGRRAPQRLHMLPLCHPRLLPPCLAGSAAWRWRRAILCR